MNKTGGSFNKSGFKFSLEKIEGAYLNNLEELVRLFCQIIKKLSEEDVITTLDIGQLNKLHSELKYHEKMKNTDEEHPTLNRCVQEALRHLKFKSEQFPKIKHMNSGYKGELATIAQKYSQQNLLSNYLRKNHNTNSKYRRLAEVERHSQTLNLQNQVYRQQTRRSLDNPHHDRKPLYSELQRIKGKETTMNSPGKIKGEYGRKFVIKSKLPNYTISKLI